MIHGYYSVAIFVISEMEFSNSVYIKRPVDPNLGWISMVDGSGFIFVIFHNG